MKFENFLVVALKQLYLITQDNDLFLIRVCTEASELFFVSEHISF